MRAWGGLCAIVLAGCRIGFDAIPADAGEGDAPQVEGCPASALLCEDFELGDLRRWNETRIQGPATAMVSTTRVHGGAFALETRVEAAASDGGNAMPTLTIPEQAAGLLAVRQWINLGAALRDFNLLLELRHATTGAYVTAGGNYLANWVSTEEDSSGAVDHRTTAATPALDVWTCLELVFTFPPPGPARFQLFVDDAMVLDVPSAYITPAFNEISIGIVRADLTGFSLFTDDVVIANERIGCQ